MERFYIISGVVIAAALLLFGGLAVLGEVYEPYTVEYNAEINGEQVADENMARNSNSVYIQESALAEHVDDSIYNGEQFSRLEDEGEYRDLRLQNIIIEYNGNSYIKQDWISRHPEVNVDVSNERNYQGERLCIGSLDASRSCNGLDIPLGF